MCGVPYLTSHHVAVSLALMEHSLPVE